MYSIPLSYINFTEKYFKLNYNKKTEKNKYHSKRIDILSTSSVSSL